MTFTWNMCHYTILLHIFIHMFDSIKMRMSKENIEFRSKMLCKQHSFHWILVEYSEHFFDESYKPIIRLKEYRFESVSLGKPNFRLVSKLQENKSIDPSNKLSSFIENRVISPEFSCRCNTKLTLFVFTCQINKKNGIVLHRRFIWCTEQHCA